MMRWIVAAALTVLLALGIATAARADDPSPASPGCTQSATTANDLSTFLGSLTAGDVGCLHGGTYSDGCAFTWSGSGTATQPITVRSYPGEWAVITSQITLSGSNSGLRFVERSGTPSSCSTDTDGFKFDGAGNFLLDSIVAGTPRHGVLQGTSSSSSNISRNVIHDPGCAFGSTLVHGIYAKTSGQINRNVVYNVPCGYNIQLYSAPSDMIVSGNTVIGMPGQTRGGFYFGCGSNCHVVNNISVNHPAGYGAINWQSCASNCTVDYLLSYNEGDPATHGPLGSNATNVQVADPLFADSDYRLSALSPAVDWSNAAFVIWPDMDGVVLPDGLAADSGAFEYVAPAPSPTPTPTATPSPSPEPTPTPSPTPTPTPEPCQEPAHSGPTGLMSTGQTRTSVSLDWTSYPGYTSAETDYRISTYASATASQPIKTTDVPDSTGTVSGLTRSTTYWFTVAAIIPSTCDQQVKVVTDQSSRFQQATKR